MNVFEQNETSLLQFMEKLEDILGYVDRFTCGHDIFLDMFSPSRIAKTSLDIHNTKTNEEEILKTKQIFEIKRKSKTTESETCIKVHIKLKKIEEKFIVNRCHLEVVKKDMKFFKRVNDRASLRDYLCLYLVPLLNIFPLLHIYLHENITEYPIGISEKPSFCLKTQNVFIYLNNEDQIVTFKDDALLRIWEFDVDEIIRNLSEISNTFHEEKIVFGNDLIMFLSYIIGYYK